MYFYKLLWKALDKTSLKTKHKQNIFLLICTVVCGLLGALIWFTVGDDLLGKSIKWMICFIGYPSIILGFFCGILYLFKLDQK